MTIETIYLFFAVLTGVALGFVIGPPLRDRVYKWRFERYRRKEAALEQTIWRVLKSMMNDGYESFDDMVYDHYAHGHINNVQYEAIRLALDDDNFNEAVRLFEKYHNEK